jgi:hypothetical protein
VTNQGCVSMRHTLWSFCPHATRANISSPPPSHAPTRPATTEHAHSTNRTRSSNSKPSASQCQLAPSTTITRNFSPRSACIPIFAPTAKAPQRASEVRVHHTPHQHHQQPDEVRVPHTPHQHHEEPAKFVRCLGATEERNGMGSRPMSTAPEEATTTSREIRRAHSKRMRATTASTANPRHAIAIAPNAPNESGVVIDSSADSAAAANRARRMRESRSASATSNVSASRPPSKLTTPNNIPR